MTRILRQRGGVPQGAILGRVSPGRGDAEVLTMAQLRRLGLGPAAAAAQAVGQSLIAGTNITITDNGDGTFTIASTGGGGSVGPRQGSVTKPLVAAFTQTNFQASTVAVDGVTGIMLTDTVATAANFRVLEKAAPATPYSVYAHFGMVPYNSQAGLILRDSSGGKLYMLGKFQNQIIITVWNSVSSFAGNRVLANAWMDTPWFRVDVTSTTITAFVSSNGLDWFQIAVETIASFLTAVNRMGFAIQTDSVPIGILCDSFSTVAPV